MNNNWVFLFPGQGSQYVGMGRDFYENYSEVRELFENASDTLKLNVTRLCFEGTEDVLAHTQNIQPAITVVNLACLTVLRLHEIHPVAAAGHSIGEYSALHAAGVLKLDYVLKLTKLRGQFMHEASLVEPGSMAAIVGLQEEDIRGICTLSGAEAASINCADQIVITGSEVEVNTAIEMCKKAGAKRCVKLNVRGPWHSKYMQLARQKFESHVQACNFQDPHVPVINNIDGRPLKNGAEAAEKLVAQICGPVLWRQSIEHLIQAGYMNFVEVGPKWVLRDLVRRIDRNVNAINVENGATLADFLQAE